jgi:hypothetical protein
MTAGETLPGARATGLVLPYAAFVEAPGVMAIQMNPDLLNVPATDPAVRPKPIPVLCQTQLRHPGYRPWMSCHKVGQHFAGIDGAGVHRPDIVCALDLGSRSSASLCRASWLTEA